MWWALTVALKGTGTCSASGRLKPISNRMDGRSQEVAQSSLSTVYTLYNGGERSELRGSAGAFDSGPM
jgi:hypothetical protein